MSRRRTLSIVVSLAVAGIGVSAPTATAATATTANDQPQVVQLGDSYSAGNGAGSYEETLCWRSPANYGARVAEQIGATYDNVACSGGVVADLLTPRQLGTATLRTATYPVPGKAPNAEHHWQRQARQNNLCGVPAQDDWSYETTITSSVVNGTGRDRTITATARCQLTAAPQIDAVTPETDAVFVTIGGNDIGFSGIVIQCMVLRSPAGCEGAIDTANAKVPALKADTKAALAAVHERSAGNADVYLLGYPFLLNTDSYGIPEATPTYDFGASLADLQLTGDAAQSAAMAELDATTGDFTFVDVKPAWGGHAHGLDPHTVPDNSAAWLVPVLAPGTQLPEWVHPTADGYAASASALLAAMN